MDSTRLPGKPLLRINGKTIVRRVYEQAKQSSYLDQVVILTDSQEIFDEVRTFGGECLCRPVDCLNGTERIRKNLDLIGNYDIIVNIQGDEPYIDPRHIDQCIENYLAKRATDPTIVCGTLHYRIDPADQTNPSIGKLVLDKSGNIMYVSRSPIPVDKQGKVIPDHPYLGHIGLFVYDREYLENNAEADTPYQLAQDIEWLKIMEQGYRINSIQVDRPERSVDTPEDLLYLMNRYESDSR